MQEVALVAENELMGHAICIVAAVLVQVLPSAEAQYPLVTAVVQLVAEVEEE